MYRDLAIVKNIINDDEILSVIFPCGQIRKKGVSLLLSNSPVSMLSLANQTTMKAHDLHEYMN